MPFWVCEVRIYFLFAFWISRSVELVSDYIFVAARTFPALMGYGAGLAIGMSGFNYAGGLWGHKRDKDLSVDEFERRTQLRKNYRIPGEQTLAELGEGRGMWF